MTTKKELLETIKLGEEALRSCYDNYGSESADYGEKKNVGINWFQKKKKLEIAQNVKLLGGIK